MNNLLSQLPRVVFKIKKRKGRGIGSGRGVKSGRGTTRHQKARESIPLHFEGGQGRLVKRFPLLRGKGKNRSNKTNKYVIYTKDLNRFEESAVIDEKLLKKAGLIDNKIKNPEIKIIVKGDLKKKLIIALPISRTAKKAIESAGGNVKSL
ncbi:50S ribosomal protein L15 [Candidatus Roizmanbacteria bacterium CG_4_10_14_0_8_um_filter_33_9]|uniref:Large ribosomal subunit protein uL15 n=1 Tax=Candidatus Roizmanbacteria bacterium CG_4_10_14_0_8_um_filter_33_9 TaxID=1974826 RepID=A0A2M7QIE2_9BACT|nr:MAG: 50S ribosomal protein L15 [Candidatus Roizmanbacteria bacterium CG_4_10_14_0_8_um_filter_33_9]